MTVTMFKNGDVFDPEVVSDMISAKVSQKSLMTGYTKTDTTLQGTPGSTKTIPVWGYIGQAVDLQEGEKIDSTKMSYTTKQYTIKKIGKGVEITDEAQLSGYGNPIGEATNQIAKSIAEKLDNDSVDVLYGAKNIVDDTTAVIKYSAIVDGTDKFDEEVASQKVIIIAPEQMSTLRKDPDFTSADKYEAGVLRDGAIGRISGCDVRVSKKVKKFSEWYKYDESGTAITSTNLAEVQKSLPFAKVGEKVTKVTTPAYFNPIIKLTNDAETEDDAPAITYFLKRGELVEHDRHVGVSDEIVCTAFGMPALTNEEKVVILKVKA